MKKYLQNVDLLQIWNIIKGDKLSHTNSTVWLTLADKAIKGAFNDKPVFTGLCHIMVQAYLRKEKDMGKQNSKYSEEFTNFLVILASFSNRALDLFRQNLEGRSIQNIRRLRKNEIDCLTDLKLCYENVARFKQLIDTLRYDDPITAMTDNTKLKSGLYYSSQFSCIIGSTLNNDETKITDYDQIPQISLPKFPLVVIALIPNNGSDKTSTIADFYQELLINIAPQLNLHILSIGSDGALVEFQAQTIIQSMATNERLQMIDTRFEVTFSCPILLSIGSVVRVQDLKHAKKTCRNIIMSGTRVLSLGRSTARFDHFLHISQRLDSIMYKQDVVKLDRQDDGAAYRAFCSSNLRNVYLQHLENPEDEKMCGFFVLLFIFDFTYAELIHLIPKIAQCFKALRNNNLIYEKEKSVREGYHYDYYNMDLNTEQLNILRDWLTDSTIRDCFKDSFSVAMELCEALGIDVPSENNLNLTYVELIILIQNRVDNDISMDNEIINELPVDEDLLLKENDISTAIEIASKQTGFLSLSDDDIVELDVGDLAKQVDVIVQNTRSNLTPGIINSIYSDDVNLGIQYTLTDGQLNLVEMIEIRVKHEAYSSKKLERKYRGEQIANNSDPGIINLNKASHMVAHLINNENPEIRFVTQREKLPNIDCANVNIDNPLSNNQFVIAIFGSTLCIARVIAMYYEAHFIRDCLKKKQKRKKQKKKLCRTKLKKGKKRTKERKKEPIYMEPKYQSAEIAEEPGPIEEMKLAQS
ncbi:hypothetical protein RhiirC2_871301 [Rhizophagus irregularis]|uniref:Uncharacterized protein n=1 Tax=Rhizophagus irregularis TaxID=588596 RepID=A0A2N1MCJ2_9GLOM|nr:hypothetical protein RhiirC2_871301 [Rhizophagus irregularis]